jgi:hypothetical protein
VLPVIHHWMRCTIMSTWMVRRTIARLLPIVERGRTAPPCDGREDGDSDGSTVSATLRAAAAAGPDDGGCFASHRIG